jgi:hypothetical protein
VGQVADSFHSVRFGAPYWDGYGINCMSCIPCLVISSIVLNVGADLTGSDVIKFGIESKHSSPLTSTDGFKAAISEALLEMKSVCSAHLESSNNVVSHL